MVHKKDTGKWSYLLDEFVCVRNYQYNIVAFGKLKEINNQIILLLPYTASRSTPILNRLEWLNDGKPLGIDEGRIGGMERVTEEYIHEYIKDFNKHSEAQRTAFLISDLENKIKLEEMEKDKSRKVGLQ